MARTYYFQLKPEGLSTPEAECLSSYLHRLAAYHGVTMHQLISHLRSWKDLNCPFSRELPKHCQSGRFNSYGADIAVLVNALDRATGLNCLSACTLLSVRSVAGRNCVGSVKRSRAWCPACYANAEERGSPIYDRQAWQIVGVETCLTHHIPLATRCWSCGEIQRSQTSRTCLSRCELCEAVLSKNVSTSTIRPDNRYTLRHVASFIAYISARPDLIFSGRNLATFCNLMVDRYTRRKLIEDLGDVFHRRNYNAAPSVSSLLDISTYFDIPLSDLLISPVDAIAQMDLGFDPVIRERDHRPRRDRLKTLDLAILHLRRALSAGPPYPSVHSICAEAGVNTSHVFQSAPSLTERLVKLRRKSNAEEKLRKIGQIARLLKREEEMHQFTTERSRIAWIASRTGASINLVRKICSAQRR